MTIGSTGLTGSHRASGVEIRHLWAARLDRTALLIRITPSRGRRLGAPARLTGPLILAAAAVLVYLLPVSTGLLEYSREAISRGQIWRLVTGHWTHTSLDHLTWDVVAFLALGGAAAWRGRGLFWRTVLGSAAAISAALLLLAPQWQTYRGLSGIDSALFVALAATLWLESERRADRWLGAVAQIVFVGKLGFERLTGSALFTTETPGHEVVPLAHFAGAGVGLTAALSRRRRHARADPRARDPIRDRSSRARPSRGCGPASPARSRVPAPATGRPRRRPSGSVAPPARRPPPTAPRPGSHQAW